MDFEIVDDFSISVEFLGREILLDFTFDRIDLFRPIGFSILKIVTSEGFLRMGTDIEDAEQIAENAQIIPIERPSIRRSEYEFYKNYLKMADYDKYLDVMTSELDDNWLE